MPETLEQLKIGLENITHVHVNTNKTGGSAGGGGGSAGLSSQASTNALSAMVSPHPAPYAMQPGTNTSEQQQPQQVVIYQTQEYIISDPNYAGSEADQLGSRAQEYIVEGTSYAAVVAGEFQPQPPNVVHSAPDQSNVELQQKPVVSRRTSSEINSTPAVPLTDASAGEVTDAGTPNAATMQREQERQLSNQSSIDRIDSSSSLVGLQLKLAQLTVGTETPKSAVAVTTDNSQSLHPQQQSAVTSPSVEQVEPKFANEAKPLIRKVSRFQVQTVQESPRVALTEDTKPQRIRQSELYRFFIADG
ncbi:hypothetical protein ZHAS_00018000 [Anopheles sinensis]|uniref:Uncharacterized protein n=1 Tax=Anopheles sinensis TaxID=74873 RepID=A0A084WIB9_ANOSI|nr:hypothetical protein ZHAS_00018000 [Anopheles sinensis]